VIAPETGPDIGDEDLVATPAELGVESGVACNALDVRRHASPPLLRPTGQGRALSSIQHGTNPASTKPAEVTM
jgi:hypothetical protein